MIRFNLLPKNQLSPSFKIRMIRLACTLGMFALLGTYCQGQSKLNPHIKLNGTDKKVVENALQNGFVSLKTDVQIVDGEMICGEGHSLESMYLDPLREQAKANGGSIYRGHPHPFYLLLELPNAGRAELKVLHDRLSEYKDFLATTDSKARFRAIKVVLVNPSSTARKSILEQEFSFIAFEGNLADVNGTINTNDMPLIGIDYASTANESDLKRLVKQTHRQGKKLRLYNVPNDKALWEDLIGTGVDFISSEDRNNTRSITKR